MLLKQHSSLKGSYGKFSLKRNKNRVSNPDGCGKNGCRCLLKRIYPGANESDNHLEVNAEDLVLCHPKLMDFMSPARLALRSCKESDLDHSEQVISKYRDDFVCYMIDPGKCLHKSIEPFDSIGVTLLIKEKTPSELNNALQSIQVLVPSLKTGGIMFGTIYVEKRFCDFVCASIRKLGFSPPVRPFIDLVCDEFKLMFCGVDVQIDNGRLFFIMTK